MNILKILIFVVVGWSFGPAALAQEIQKPTYKDGNTCQYKDKFGNNFRQVVTVKPDGGFTLTAVGEGFGEETREFNQDHKMVKLGRLEYSPHWPSPDFPIKVGASGPLGSSSYTSSTGVTTKVKSTLKPVRIETVEVPAGAFQALLVEVDVDYTRDSGRGGRHVTSTWYDASGRITRPLKQAFYYNGQAHARDSWERALISCD